MCPDLVANHRPIIAKWLDKVSLKAVPHIVALFGIGIAVYQNANLFK